VDGVGVSNNDNLHVQLEVAVTLIPSELHPHFTGGYCATCHMRPSGDLHVSMRGEGKSNKSTTSYSRLQLWQRCFLISPPPAENLKGAILALRFSSTAAFASVFRLLLLVSETWNTFT